MIAEHLLARFGEFEPFDFGRSPAANYALGALGDESDALQARQLVGREAMHKHDRFGAAFGTAAREQHDSAALMGLGGASARRRQGYGRDTVGSAIHPKTGLNLLFGTPLGHFRR